MKVLVLTGMPGSGKSEAVKVAEEMGIPVHRMGDLVREMVKAKGFEVNRANLASVGNSERKKLGSDVWARRTARTITNAPIVVIDGARSLAEVEYFRKELGESLMVLAILSSPSTRWQRISKRGRDDDIKSLEELRERDGQELKWGLGEVIATADLMIVNESGKGHLRGQMRQVLLELGSHSSKGPPEETTFTEVE